MFPGNTLLRGSSTGILLAPWVWDSCTPWGTILFQCTTFINAWGWGLIVLGTVQRRDNHPKCGRNWYACVTSHGGGAMLVWWPGGARTLKIPWCESRRISNSHVGNHSIQVGKSRRWITLCLWESQWIEKFRRLVPEGILRLLIQLHGYFSSVNLLACVNGCDSQPVFLALVVNPFRDGWVAIMADVKCINLIDQWQNNCTLTFIKFRNLL